MKKGFFGSIATLITSAGLTFAEPPLATPPTASLPAATPSAQAPKGDVIAPPTCATGDCFAPAACQDCGVWFTAEYLMWWIKDSPMPAPLMTTGTNGILGDPNTRVVLGSQDIDNKMRHGGRLSMGYWLDGEHTKGIELNGFFLGKRWVDQSATQAGAGDPRLFIPFINAGSVPPSENSLSPSRGDSLVGMVSVSSMLFGSEANGVFKVSSGNGWRFDLLGGFRYLQLEEDSSFIAGSQSFSTGQIQAFRDQFDARNRFFGGQLGGRFDYTQGKFFVNATGKVALGNMNQSVDNTGITATTPLGGATTITSGGIFAQGTNIGHHSRNEFAVVPEATVNVGVQFTDYCRFFVGYNFLFVSNVLRPGDQIDRQLNLSQSPFFGTGTLVGAARPTVLNHDSDFWAQGVNFGLAFRW